MILNRISTVLISAIAIVTIFDFFVDLPLTAVLSSELRNWAVLISGISLALGAINVIQLHVRNISRRKDPVSSIILLLFMGVTIGIGFTLGPQSVSYEYLYQSVVIPVGEAIFSLLAFYVTTAAYRAFRIGNRDSSVLLIAGILVLIGRVPLGEFIWPGFATIADWIVAIANTAGTRGVVIATALGYVSMAARIILGIERQSAAQT